MIKLKSLIIESMEKRKYAGIELDDSSHNLLKTKFQDKIPDGWHIIAHHMTIDPFKSLPEEETEKQVKLKVTDFGKSDKSIAVKVSGYEGKTNNKFPHVTLAIDKAGGGKPKDSNEITDWQQVNDDIYITGTIKNL